MSGELQRTEEQLHEQAESLGCELRLGNKYALLVDLDTEQARAEFAERLAFLQEIGLISERAVIERWASRNGNEHAEIRVPAKKVLGALRATTYLPCFGELSNRLFLQALLGSDWKREALGALDRPNPSALFRPRGQ